MVNVKIRGIEIAHGTRVVDNEVYFEHFAKQGKDVKHYFEDVMGRKTRFEIEKGKENALTLATDSAKAVLKKCNLTGQDIDMIIYAGTLPEYVTPTSALLIHDAIGGNSRCFCHDMNLNCLGMTYALDMASRYISTNSKINRVLIASGDILTCGVNPENENNYGLFGDIGCSLICERTDEDCMIIDTKTGVNTEFINKSRFPSCGFSNAFDDVKKEQMYAFWEPAPPWWVEKLEDDVRDTLKENNLTMDDISMFCFTQLAYKNIEKFRRDLGIPEEKSIFVSYKYGYTGPSSPIVALYEALKENKVKRGDYVFFATAAIGGMYITELIKY